MDRSLLLLLALAFAMPASHRQEPALAVPTKNAALWSMTGVGTISDIIGTAGPTPDRSAVPSTCGARDTFASAEALIATAHPPTPIRIKAAANMFVDTDSARRLCSGTRHANSHGYRGNVGWRRFGIACIVMRSRGRQTPSSRPRQSTSHTGPRNRFWIRVERQALPRVSA